LFKHDEYLLRAIVSNKSLIYHCQINYTSADIVVHFLVRASSSRDTYPIYEDNDILITLIT